MICQFINSISYISTFSFFFSGESSVDGDSSSTTSHSDSQSEVAQIEHFAEQLVDQLAKDQQNQSQNHHHHHPNNSDHTFHPITTEGLQVISNYSF